MHKPNIRLVGILVTLVLVFVLGTMVGYVLYRVHRGACRAGCLDRLQSIRRAMTSYADEHDGCFPLTSGDTCRALASFDLLLAGDYLCDPEVLCCPADGRAEPGEVDPGGLTRRRCSYSIDLNLGPDGAERAVLLSDDPTGHANSSNHGCGFDGEGRGQNIVTLAGDGRWLVDVKWQLDPNIFERNPAVSIDSAIYPNTRQVDPNTPSKETEP